ncbi:unnamed protein product [Auanema sp. JU1783]|nr:unnamed protein product [Auanema sp. JU1783]
MKVPVVVLRFNMLSRQALHEYHSLAKQAKTTGSLFRVLQRKDVRSLSSANNKDGKLKAQTTEESAKGQLQRSILEEVLLKEDKKPTTFTGKVVEKTTNTFLYVAVAGAVALLGAFAYLLAGEFFAQDSPQAIFSKALALVRDDGRCLDLFGSTIAGFGEENSRGRRRHVAHHKYEKDGKERIRVLFHIKGDRDEGVAQAEMELREGTWEWRFLYVETKSRPKTTHVLIDNR